MGRSTGYSGGGRERGLVRVITVEISNELGVNNETGENPKPLFWIVAFPVD